MYLKQRDIFRSLDKKFVKEIMNIAETVALASGGVLFREGDSASWFYILLKGRIRLRLGQTGQVVYTVSHGGEAFGWSSLVGRQSYSASAECLTATQLLKFDRGKLEKVIAADPANGVKLFRSLAAILGDRLIHYYTAGLSDARAEGLPCSGTGQIADVLETQQ